MHVLGLSSVSEELTSRPGRGNTATCQTEKGPREVAERSRKRDSRISANVYLGIYMSYNIPMA